MPWIVLGAVAGSLAVLALAHRIHRAGRRQRAVRIHPVAPILPASPAPVARGRGRRRTAAITPRKTAVIEPYLGPEGVAGWLVSIGGTSPHTTAVCNRAGDTAIGADPRCGIVVDDPLASATHAVISGRSGYFKIIDRNSTNGVFVDGERVLGERMLRTGMRLRIGHTTFVWFAIDPGGTP